MAVKNDLSSFAATGVAGGNFRLEKLPSLAQLVETYGLREAARKFDQEAETWRQSTERQLREQFAKAQPIPASDLG